MPLLDYAAMRSSKNIELDAVDAPQDDERIYTLTDIEPDSPIEVERLDLDTRDAISKVVSVLWSTPTTSLNLADKRMGRCFGGSTSLALEFDALVAQSQGLQHRVRLRACESPHRKLDAYVA